MISHFIAAPLHESSLFDMIQSVQSLLRIAILLGGFCMPCAQLIAGMLISITRICLEQGVAELNETVENRFFSSCVWIDKTALRFHTAYLVLYVCFAVLSNFSNLVFSSFYVTHKGKNISMDRN